MQIHRIAAATLILLGSAFSVSSALAEEQTYRFDWPVPSSAKVTLDAERKGHKVTSAMRLDLKEAGEDLEMSFADVRLLALDGKDVSSPEAQKKLPMSLGELSNSMPSFIISRDGRFKDLVGLDALINTIIDNLPEGEQQIPKKQLKEMLSSPRMIAMLKAHSASDWHAWVQGWIGKPVQPGTETTFESKVEAYGEQIPATVKLLQLGPDERWPGSAGLRLEVVSEGEAFKRAIFNMITSVMQRTGRDTEGFELEKIKSARREELIEVITDARTLRPYEVKSAVSASFEIADQARQGQVDRKHYRFEWQ